MKIQDIVNKEFSRSILGYDCREVDTFLDLVIDRMTEYENERQEILEALEYLLRELENTESKSGIRKKKQLKRPAFLLKEKAETAEQMGQATLQERPETSAAPEQPDEAKAEEIPVFEEKSDEGRENVGIATEEVRPADDVAAILTQIENTIQNEMGERKDTRDVPGTDTTE